ncbi:MAG: hypothetical protein WCT14_19540, partial [Treponemataceae bacterium]
ATIKSRCQQFNFRLIHPEVIQTMLKASCAEMKIEADDEALFWIAKEATGSMRDAYTLLDQVASFSDGRLSAELIREKLGLVGLDAVNGLAEACAEGRTADALGAVDSVLDRGVAIEQFIVDLAEYYRSLLLLKNGIDRESLLGYSPDRFSKIALEAFSAVQIERAVSLLLDLYRDIRFSVSPRFELETAVSRLCWLKSWVSPAELRAAIDGVRGRLLSPSPSARWGPNDAESSTSSASGSFEAPLVESSPHAEATPHTEASRVASVVENPPAKNIDLTKPGGLTEGFKRFMAERDGRVIEKTAQHNPASSIPAAVPQSPPSAEVPFDHSAPTLEAELEPETESPPDELPSSGVDTASLKNAVIIALKKERGMLASGLEKSAEWKIEGGKVIIPAADRLAAELLKKDSAVIAVELSKAAGFACEADIREQAPKNGDSGTMPAGKQEMPPQVETVRRLFRGTVVRIAAKQQLDRSNT